MYNSFIYSVNTVLPVFIIVALGWILLRMKLITPDFTATAEKLVFKVALPAMLFCEVSSADLAADFDGRFIVFCCLGILITFVLLCIFVPLFIKRNDRRGAFIQGVYRSNFAILGIPLAESMFGSEGTAQISMIMPFSIIMFNMFAVLILSIYAPKEVKLTLPQFARRVVGNIIKNPLIISVVAGIPFMLLSTEFPLIITKSLNCISDMVMPLSLICIGAGFKFESLRGRTAAALTAALLRLLVVPVIAVGIAVAVGFRGAQLGIILILFGAPTAVSSYVMAKNMKSDHELAAQIILLTTLLCALTMFAGVFLLKNFGYI
ncbi:MAG: AEC family transporter [Eubacteriales bacterium]|nr:AEC family transporter [Eubacteriales bacterium]